MKAVMQAQKFYLLSLIYLLQRQKPIEFQRTLENISRLVILLPVSRPVDFTDKTLKGLLKLFKKADITIIAGDDYRSLLMGLKAECIFLPDEVNSILKLNACPELQHCLEKPADCMIDLHHEESLLSFYMLYKLKSELKVGLRDSRALNLQYLPGRSASYPENILKLTNLLSKMKP